ncbi:hypothetical protein JTE90_016888 [Oedothorax gibbosus]|uniref:Reverse transcriptase domain-containing protein n=1 Tax=Oedothorax gibbosus TaxID=931172 RepID=A0AAV6TFW4_9ARAC|nr:hypothetical protein JTE90_016888 [Oedothorax gibbosus]
MVQYHFEISDLGPIEESAPRGAIFDPITKGELENSVNIQCLDKAPGPDGMGPRKIGVSLGNETRNYCITKGCPQGSSLGPSLWNVIANNILNEFENSDADVLAYADDFCMIFSAGSRRALENIEAVAILKTLEIFSNTNYKSINIYSDSMSSVVASAALYPKSPIIMKIKTLCTELADKTINLGWV